MSIFELFFNCNKEKTNSQMSCTERFQSCMFTTANKAAAENGSVCNERKVYELPLNSGTTLTSSAHVPEVDLLSTLTLAPLLIEPDTEYFTDSPEDTYSVSVTSSSTCGNTPPPLQETLFLQVVGDATGLEESYAKLQTHNTDVLSSGKVKAIEQEKEEVVESEFVEKGALAKYSPINDIVSPTQHDTLFWCIYIVIHGYNDYLQIGRNYGVKELELKKLIGESIQSYPNQLKQTNYKITKVAIQEILSDLMTSQKETNMLCLIAMISYFKLNIIIVNSTNKLMLEFVCLPDITLPTYILYKDAYGKYSIKTTPIYKVEIEMMKSTMVCLENYIKPLKPISTYKIDDLIFIAKKVGIYNETDKPKKNELYEQINNNIMWR